MKVMLAIFAVLSVASAQHWNNPNWAVGPAAPVQDTPEVAAAKAAHFAALARVQPQSQQQAQWGQPQNQWNAPQQQAQSRYQGPLALPPGFDQNGAPLPVQDTAEVAAERARHFNLVGGYGAPNNYQWNAAGQQQQQQPQWNPAAAQNQWNAAPQQPQWNAAPQQPQWNPAAAQNQWNAAPQNQWNAAPQQPQWNNAAVPQQQQQWNAQQWNPAAQQQQQQGLPADTPEVAAAKAAHLAAHAQLHGRRRRSLVAATPIAYTAHAVVPSAHHVLTAPAFYAAHYW
uniref:Uncharacterized protein n=1 Tax=Rhodnius prolixus TaxID=13249 RepID=T1I000_RHOPR